MNNSVQANPINSMTEHQHRAAEDTRIIVSDHLTNILLLMGRLEPVCHLLSLPSTLKLLMPLIHKLEDLGKNNINFQDIFKENIVVREKHSKVFSIPMSLRRDPTIHGLCSTVYRMADSMIRKYCNEEKKRIVAELDNKQDRKEKTELLMKAIDDFTYLIKYCTPENKALIQNSITWCRFEMSVMA
jgi:hypothetical protein